MSKKKDKNGPTRRTNNPRKRVAQDFREFKGRLKRWIDGTRLVWEGAPYAEGSVYRFVLDERLINFVFSVAMRAREQAISEGQAQKSTLKMAESILNSPDLDHEDGEENNSEKFLTFLESEDNINSDEEAIKEAQEGPEWPSGEEEDGAPMGDSNVSERGSESR